MSKRFDEVTPGGAYLVRGQMVNANGEPIKGAAGATGGGASAKSATPDATWKNDDIRAFAAEKGVDLGDTTTKADMLAAIQAATEGDGGE